MDTLERLFKSTLARNFFGTGSVFFHRFRIGLESALFFQHEFGSVSNSPFFLTEFRIEFEFEFFFTTGFGSVSDFTFFPKRILKRILFRIRSQSRISVSDFWKRIFWIRQKKMRKKPFGLNDFKSETEP